MAGATWRACAWRTCPVSYCFPVEALRHPVGPLPPSVYWRRRLLILAALIVLVVLVAWACANGGADGPRNAAQGQNGGQSGAPGGGATSPPPITPGPTPSGPAINMPPVFPQASPTGNATLTPRTKGAAATSGGVGSTTGCTATSARLSVTPDREAYPAGTHPRFRVTVDNTSDTACAIDLGSGFVALLVTSGTDRVWNSTDCPSLGSAPVVVPPHQARTETVTWTRVRSRPGCVSGQPAAGLGRYAVEAAVGNLSSGKTYFTLS